MPRTIRWRVPCAFAYQLAGSETSQRFIQQRGLTMVNISGEAIDTLKASVRGRIISPSETDYDEARKVWNATIDRRPALIVRCAGTADVIAALAFARENGLLVSIRGGSHNIAGSAVSDDALMIDLSAHEIRAHRSASETRVCRTRRAALRLRPRSTGIRSRDAARHQLDDRRRGSHARRRLRLDQPQVRRDGRQSRRGGDRHGGRHMAARERGRAIPIFSGRCAAAAATSAS